VQSQNTTSERPQRAFVALFILLLALYCWWIVSLPLFPTQDDPMHLYYVSVLSHLDQGSSTFFPIFEKFFFVRHPLPPYTVHYVILRWLTGFLSSVQAEKCMACLILVTTAFGLRFLAQAVGKNSGVMSLWIIPVSLSWPLFMGFHNYCLSLGFGLWALGIWFRAARSDNRALYLLFLLVIVLILFTHPVPLLFVLAIVAADVFIRLGQDAFFRAEPARQLLVGHRWRILFAALAFSSLTYVAHFVNRSNTAKNLTEHFSRAEVASSLIRLDSLWFATGAMSQLYRVALYASLLLSLYFAFHHLRHSWKNRELDASAVLLLCALAMIVVVPLLPRDMNGSEHFSDRLVICIWIAVIAAASSGPAFRPRLSNIVAISAALLALFAIGLADHLIRPVANRLSLIEQVPVKPHRLGILLDAPIREHDPYLTFDPYARWAGARYFRRSNAVLLNSPWLDLPILPLGLRPNPLTDRFSPFELTVTPSFHQHLLASPADRQAVLSAIDLIVFVGRPQPRPSAPDPLLANDSAHRWRCTQNVWYFVCEARQQPK
jgi:hypothetical protein